MSVCRPVLGTGKGRGQGSHRCTDVHVFTSFSPASQPHPPLCLVPWSPGPLSFVFFLEFMSHIYTGVEMGVVASLVSGSGDWKSNCSLFIFPQRSPVSSRSGLPFLGMQRLPCRVGKPTDAQW